MTAREGTARSAASATLEVVVADGATMFREAVQSLLAAEPEYEAHGVADTNGLVEVVAARRPAVALIDLDLPPHGAVAAVEALRSRSATQLIVWSFDAPQDAVLAAVRAGAAGFLSKRVSPDGLLRALAGIRNGEAPLARDLAWMLVQSLHEHEERGEARRRTAVLSRREREVLRLVAGGCDNREIAEQLNISQFTVKRHIHNILEKLRLPSRQAAGLMYRAARFGDGGELGQVG